MPNLSQVAKSLFAGAFAVSLCSSQPIDITGTVLDSASSQPIENASVLLVQLPEYTCTTNAQGQFTLASTGSIPGHDPRALPFEFAVKGNALTLSGINRSAAAAVEVFNSAGLLMYRSEKEVQIGEHPVFASLWQTPGLYLVKIRVGAGEQVIKCFGTSVRHMSLGTSSANAGSAGQLARKLASLTIEVSKSGYITKQVMVPTYTSDVGIVRLSASVTDIDGNVYHTVTIGTQVWMLENLKTTRYNDGSAIPLVTDSTTWGNLTTPGYCWYSNDSTTYKSTYGALYDWYAVNTGKLAPTGWHVPTDHEWSILIKFLGDSIVAGGKLKETGIIHWRTPNAGATNETGFSALPGGYRDDNGKFSLLGYYGYWWSSSAFSATGSWLRQMGYGDAVVNRAGSSKGRGFSVRCVQNNNTNSPSAPVISSAVGGDGCVTLGWDTVSGATSYSIYYKAGTTVDTVTGTSVTWATSPEQVTGLTNGTQYAFAVSAENAAGKSGLSAVRTATPNAAPAAPSITEQPQSDTATVGQSATFNVTATGTAPLSYQWYKDGNAISGATSSSYSLSNVQAAASGTYTVTVSNGIFPDATSNGAKLTVLAADSACTIVPYTSDANTILLDHFDGSTSASFNAYAYNGATGCGSAFPAATPSYTYDPGQNGLGQAVTMSPPAGQPAGSASYLRYSTVDIICLANGTIEFWAYPRARGLSLVDQGQYYSSCGGWTFRIGIDTSGHLWACDWDYTGCFTMTSSEVVPLNAWGHVAVTWGSAGAKLYLNGVQVGSHASTDHPASGFGGYVMMLSGTCRGVSCAVDELRISNVQRTSFNVCTR